MRLWDYLDLSVSNLWKRKLRTTLTTCGVMIGIGALVAMLSFGKGIQRNVTEGFQTLELFNYITVFASPLDTLSRAISTAPQKKSRQAPGTDVRLDDAVLETIRSYPGVETVFPDIRFPAQIRMGDRKEFTFVQAIPTRIRTAGLLQLRAGDSFDSDIQEAVILSDSLLRRLGVDDYEAAVGDTVTISTLVLDLSDFPLADLAGIMTGGRLPFREEPYTFPIVAVSERLGFGGPSLLRSDAVIPMGVSDSMEKLVISNISDLFNSGARQTGYAMVNVKLSSPRYVDAVKTMIEEAGFQTFALIDQLEEIKAGFMFMDMFLLAVGMIAIVVASLGIVNTMVMSILERYSEIGVMKAVGAGNRDIQRIFVFESSLIGLLGGISGLVLGWVVSRIINQVANYFLAQQGIPQIEYFNFPLWICVGSIFFAILVSLVSGIYPAIRAARVDPVVALRHD
jgi:putative ABC transport system permease protein